MSATATPPQFALPDAEAVNVVLAVASLIHSRAVTVPEVLLVRFVPPEGLDNVNAPLVPPNVCKSRCPDDSLNLLFEHSLSVMR